MKHKKVGWYVPVKRGTNATHAHYFRVDPAYSKVTLRSACRQWPNPESFGWKFAEWQAIKEAHLDDAVPACRTCTKVVTGK